MKLLVALAILVGVVGYGKADDISDEYDAKLEAAFAEAAKEGAVGLNVTSSQYLQVAQSFDCDVYGPSDSVPTSVHKLRPGDIKVVAAIGDSLTAAQGAKAKTVFTVTTNYRGVAFSIGGDSDALTVANFIKKYNPNVFGASTGSGGPDSSNARLNVAVSGAKAKDIKQQAEDLQKKLKEEESKGNLNYDEDWKLVTIFIGANDLCAYCKDTKTYSPENYKTRVEEALDVLKKIPRTYVSLVNILDINPLAELGGWLCDIVKFFACDCADKRENKMAPKEYQKALEELVESIDDDNDFTVVLQPLLENYVVPRKNDKLDGDYFAPDCFHFNQLAHGQVAIGLWNNMFEEEGNKTKDWNVKEGVLKCPKENYCLTTRKNGDGSACADQSTLTATSYESSDDTHRDSSSSYGIIVSASAVGVVVCVVMAVGIVVAIVRRGKKKTAEELPLVKCHS